MMHSERLSYWGKMLPIGCLLYFLALYGIPQCEAQPVMFNRLNVTDGLSQGSVLSILQDKQGYIWLGTREGLNRYDGYRMKIYRNGGVDDTRSLQHDYINALLNDTAGFWVGTLGGLHLYNPATDDFERVSLNSFQNGQTNSAIPSVNTLYRDRRGIVWVGTNQGIYRMTDAGKLQFEMLSTDGKTPFINARIWRFSEDKEGNLWIATEKGACKLGINRSLKQAAMYSAGTNYTFRSIHYDSIHQKLWGGTQGGGLYLWNPKQSAFEPYANVQNNLLLHNNVRGILAHKNGEVWVGTQEGINILNPHTGTSRAFQNEPNSRRSLSQNSVYALYKDNSGSVWVGTYFGGANVVYATNTPFKLKAFGLAGVGLSNNVVSQLTEDGQGNLWIGTEGGGLNYWNPTTDRTLWFKNNPLNSNSLGANLVKTVLMDRQQRLWVGTSTGGLSVLAPDRKTWQQIPLPRLTAPNYPNSEVNLLFEDHAGNIWVGTNFQELWIYNPDTKTWSNKVPGTSLPLNEQNRIYYQFLQDGRGTVWVATSEGVYFWKGDSTGLKELSSQKGITGQLPSRSVYSLLEDNTGNIWMGTQRGLAKYTPAQNAIETFTQTTGLNDRPIYGLLEDAAGDIWASSQKGLIRHSIIRNETTIYDMNDGLPDNEFNIRSALMDRRGILYFGTYNGLVYFNPEEIEMNPASSRVAFCGFRLFNEPVEVGDSLDILQSSLNNGSTLYLQHHQNVFSIEYSLLNFIKPYKTRYAHILQGYDKDWIYSTQPSVTYSKLAPGTYTLLVKAANNDGRWIETPTSLTIVIQKPWWLTGWAIGFYTLLAAAAIFFVARFVWLRARYRRQQAMQQFKLDFFTNLSHEIRTHLTLIAAPVEQVMLQRSQDATLIEQLLPVKANAEKLQTLVREMMDLRRAETNHLELKIEKFNLPAFLQEVLLSVQSIADKKNITLLLQCQQLELPMYFDGIQMEKVFFNLLTNALKFTPEGGTIKLLVQDEAEKVLIHIEDNGVGMDEKTISQLFTSYFQAGSGQQKEAGYGLGLALAKSITELHKGTLEVSSYPETATEDGYTCFTITLAKGFAHFADQTPLTGQIANQTRLALFNTTNGSQLAAQPPLEKVLPHLLLAEDNEELRHFLTQSLSGKYQITACANGEEAFAATLSLLPDLVISDIMMPGMSGIVLCKKLKETGQTNHIPVILLTAKATARDQMEGLTAGADAYITKPFSVQMLELQIANLTASRAAMRERYVHRLTQTDTAEQSATGPEELFLRQVQQIIESHLEDSNFGVPLLCSRLAMSQTVLYKKLKALTNMSVQDFIRTVRLNKAAKLMLQGKFQVNEVAYTVGYSDRKYFSKEFKKQFGKSPSEYADNKLSAERDKA